MGQEAMSRAVSTCRPRKRTESSWLKASRLCLSTTLCMALSSLVKFFFLLRRARAPGAWSGLFWLAGESDV